MSWEDGHVHACDPPPPISVTPDIRPNSILVYIVTVVERLRTEYGVGRHAPRAVNANKSCVCLQSVKKPSARKPQTRTPAEFISSTHTHTSHLHTPSLRTSFLQPTYFPLFKQPNPALHQRAIPRMDEEAKSLLQPKGWLDAEKSQPTATADGQAPVPEVEDQEQTTMDVSFEKLLNGPDPEPEAGLEMAGMPPFQDPSEFGMQGQSVPLGINNLGSELVGSTLIATAR